jgi:hypothetical protein
MQNDRQDPVYLAVAIAVIVLAAGLTWICYQAAANPEVDDAFAPIWAGARIVITRQANPYDQDALSWVLWPSEAPVSRLVYPYYSILLLMPLGLIEEYQLAKAIWMALTMAGLVLMILSSLSLTLWRPSWKILAAFMLFSLTGYGAIRGVYTANPGIIVGMLIILGLRMVVQERSRGAGILFGLTLIKPTMVALLLPYVLLYAVSRRDFRLIRSFLITAIVLLGSAFAAFPGWFYQNFAQVVMLIRETHPSSISAVISSWFPDNQLMLVLAVGFGLWAIIEWWRSLGKDYRWFLWTAALTIVLTDFIGIPVSTSDYVVLLVPLILIFTTIERRWKTGGSVLALTLMVIIQAVQWLPDYFLTGLDLTVPEPRLMLFPLPLLTLGLLYWVRYWALSSIKLHVERIEALRHL